jgi:AcrR family transcriptional regulator
MVRVAADRPAELLDAVVGYLVEHGVAELSLRPLAKAVGSSPRVLLYYFGSKEALVAKAIAYLRERQRAGLERMRQAKYRQPSGACRAMWKHLSAPESEALFRLFLETYSLGLRRRRQYAGFLCSTVEDWLEFIAQPLVARGHPEKEARAFATIVIAGFRGFLLDYCATRDRERVDRAVELWLRSLDSIAKK